MNPRTFLDEMLFQRLLTVVNGATDDDKYRWFEYSYNAFVSYELKNATDLIRIIAFAYSWMPTMADFKINVGDLSELVDAIKSYDNIHTFDELEKEVESFNRLLKQMVPIINNSVVGASKVLHFINPKLFPIFDSRVIKGWNK